MKATVMTTGPGVIIATATASRNCRSVSQWKLVDDPAVKERDDRQAAAEDERARLGEVERDLPSSGQLTAGAGDRRRRPRRSDAERQERREPRGRAPAHQQRQRRPTPRKSQTISDSVQAVDDGADREERPQQPILPSVSFTSLSALRAMIAMTAAPMP